MKEIKNIDNIYLDKFGVEVTPYLTYAQIQMIVDGVCQFDVWADREQNIDVLLLHYVTDITDEEIEKTGHVAFLQSGLIDEVKSCVKNLDKVYKAIEYTQSTSRALTKIVKEMPKLMKPLEKVMERGSSKK